MYIQENREKSCFTSKGETTIKGVKIPYETVCEDTLFLKDDGGVLGSVFSYAYFRSDVENKSTRPVLFAFNGGPGSGSLWLHIGLLGPKRLKLDNELNLPTCPPFELEENPNCQLDMYDIVLVDPMGAGLGRLYDLSKKDEVCNISADVSYLALFIQQWLTRHGRRNSPVLLAGESYGTGRCALLASELLGASHVKSGTETLGVAVSGIMLLGSTFYDEVPAEKSILDFYTMAATYQFHKPKGLPEKSEFLKAAVEFSENEYVSALYKGDSLSKEEKLAVAEKISYFTGLTVKYVLSQNLKIKIKEYAHHVLEEENLVVGHYDGRYTWQENVELSDPNMMNDDPAMGQYIPAFQAGFSLMCDELGITFDRISRGLYFKVATMWERKNLITPGYSLGASMRRNPMLKVFFASGDYDLCTTTGLSKYLAHHSNLALERVTIKSYPSGHMAYLGEESANMMADDMRSFFGDAINPIKAK